MNESEAGLWQTEKAYVVRAILCYSFSVAFPILTLLLIKGGSIYREIEVNPTAINGILTISAIVFGFSNTRFHTKKLRLFFPTLQILSLLCVGILYFTEILLVGYPTPLTLLMATIALLIILNSWLLTQELYQRIEGKE